MKTFPIRLTPGQDLRAALEAAVLSQNASAAFDGQRIVGKSNWIGKALVFPRALLPQVKSRPELLAA